MKKLEEKDAEEIKRQNLLYEIEMRKKLKKKKEEIDEKRKLFFVSLKYKSSKKCIKSGLTFNTLKKNNNTVEQTTRVHALALPSGGRCLPGCARSMRALTRGGRRGVFFPNEFL